MLWREVSHGGPWSGLRAPASNWALLPGRPWAPCPLCAQRCWGSRQPQASGFSLVYSDQSTRSACTLVLAMQCLQTVSHALAEHVAKRPAAKVPGLLNAAVRPYDMIAWHALSMTKLLACSASGKCQAGLNSIESVRDTLQWVCE